jgi:hypothetical protein
MYAVQLASCSTIHLLSFIKTGACVQAIFRFCLNNFNCCNSGITDRRDLAVEIGSGATLYKPSSVQSGSGIQKLLGWGGGAHADKDSKVIS